MNSWAAYRTAWIWNRFDQPDSAREWAFRAHSLRPSDSRILGELLRALAGDPSEVLAYGPLVSGGGVCRFRLAQAEQRLDCPGEHTLHLERALEDPDDSVSADAACWLALLEPERGTELLTLAVERCPQEGFYRTLLASRLASEGIPEQGLRVLEPVVSRDAYYWQALARCLDAAENASAAEKAYRNAYRVRRCPSSAADLGWFLYGAGRARVRADRCPQAIPYLEEAAGLWHPDSSWSRAADSLLFWTRSFLVLENGWERLP